MKNLIVATLVLISLNAQASKKTNVISKNDFIESVKRYFSNTSGGLESFAGDIEDMNKECTVSLENNEKNQLEIVLKSEEKVLLSLPLENGEKVKVQRQEDDDGSFRNDYRFGHLLTYSLIITHVDDAYDTISLSTGSTKLECGAYY